MTLPTAAQQIADATDANLAASLSAAVSLQNAYFAENGRYWQGVPTIDDPPADGETLTPDTSRRPSDQLEDWVASGAAQLLPDQVQTRLSVDVYDGPAGAGWVVRMEFRSEGVLYRKAVNVGPESSRSHGWREVSDGAI